VLRQLGDAFANAAGSRGAPAGQAPQMHFPTPAGIDLLQVSVPVCVCVPLGCGGLEVCAVCSA
jgi:hypothetical protein